jgi:hypothetical protein
MHGLKMSYQLQKLLAIANNNKNNQQSNVQLDIIRGKMISLENIFISYQAFNLIRFSTFIIRT